MKGRHKNKQASSNKKKQFNNENDLSAEYAEDIISSDDDFQPSVASSKRQRIKVNSSVVESSITLSSSDDDFQPVTSSTRKRKSKENTSVAESFKKLKGTEKTSHAQITIDDYDLVESSEDSLFEFIFDKPALHDSRNLRAESSKSAAVGSSQGLKQISMNTSESSNSDSSKSKPVSNTPNTTAASPEPGSSHDPIDETSGDATKNSEETVDRVITVKATISSIWNKQYLEPLYDLVNTTNLVVTHTFAFAKYIFLKEIEADENFSMKEYVSRDFFVEVFLSLIIGGGSKPAKIKDVTREYRQVISKHKNSYCECAQYVPPKLLYAQQIALYECTKIHTAYHNNIKAHFGSRLRNILNKLFKKKEKMEDIRGRMNATNATKEEINKALRDQVYKPCDQMKLSVSRKEMPPVSLLDIQSIHQLKAFFSCYPDDYIFQKDPIYYDVKIKPEYHFKAFFKMAEMLETQKNETFACFPLRTTFIPCYMTIDSKIVHHHILNNKTQLKAESKYETWGTVVNLRKKAFKSQGPKKSLQFRGTMETDGVGVSVIKQNMDTNRKILRKRNVQLATNDTFKYIEELGQDVLKKTEGKCVLVDPGRRDLLFCMKESSEPSDKKIIIHRKINRNKIARHFKHLRQKTKPESIKIAEASLSKFTPHSVNITVFTNYIKEKASVEDLLRGYYGNETHITNETYFPDVCTEFTVSNKGDLYFGHLFVTRIANSATILDQTYASYLNILLEQPHIKSRLKNEDIIQAKQIISRMTMTDEGELLKKEISCLLKRLQLLPFRKMKFSSKIYYDQNDQELVKKIKNKFGQESVIILGNWSAPHVKFQEPTKNKGFIKLLKKNGFEVYLMDEFRTSSHCPNCESTLKNFKTVVNPRPYQRRSKPSVKCHGLLRCTNAACYQEEVTTSIKHRLWNRDLAAVMNFKKILYYYRRFGQRHPTFKRKSTL